MACAGGVCTNVAEHGVDPKGHMCPLLLPCALVGLGVCRGQGWGGGSLECSKLFQTAGVWAEPPCPQLVQQRVSPAVIGCFPCSWLKSA